MTVDKTTGEVEFQSTRPRGARPEAQYGVDAAREFQSTRLRGARHIISNYISQSY
ncbi:hypothetical protein HMPREF1153_1395 [Selenomonas sp. CM52]|nr:hypothetical protein HMPREF1153_1395 [Selenomonas sp. CM52]